MSALALTACFHDTAKTETESSEQPTAEPAGETGETSESAPSTPPAQPAPETQTTQEQPPSDNKNDFINDILQTVSLESGNLYFKPNNITVKVNKTVKVNYTNKGEHTFTLDEFGVNVNLAPEGGTFGFIPTKTGTFQFYCDIGGHRQAGMVGTLTVVE